jgi:hypothetical protein
MAQVSELFNELRRVERLTAALLDASRLSLENYFEPSSGGFFHLLDDPDNQPGKFSKASSATAVAFLLGSGRWSSGPWADSQQALADRISESMWASAGLEPHNPFTTAFMLEVLALLAEAGATISDMDKVNEGLARLTEDLERDGSVRIPPYESSPYLTQVAVRALRAWGKLIPNVRTTVRDWAWQSVNGEVVALRASPRDADALELAYSAILVAVLSEGSDAAQQATLRYALREFFDSQLPDGTWPRGRPIFHYPKVGNAYCYEYELLAQLLSTSEMEPYLREHSAGLIRAATAIDRQKFPLPAGGYGWSSGHHRHIKFPESWSTASVLHTCHLLNRFLAEETRRSVFDYVGTSYLPLVTGPVAVLPKGFLDSTFKYDGKTVSLRATIEERFLSPLAASVERVARGDALPRDVPSSAILFGPPGTSKTQLASLIATALGWPLLVIDPSHLLRNGGQNLHSEMYVLFQMLVATEGIVVLFDEFDELVREREKDAPQESRFLTTAMLPRLQELSNARRIVFLFATNHLEEFDLAIRRPGRFDMIVPVMPPSAAEKLSAFDDVRQSFETHDAENDTGILEDLRKLTYAEFMSIRRALVEATSKEAIRQLLKAAADTGTLNQPAARDATWENFITQRYSDIRLPPLP